MVGAQSEKPEIEAGHIHKFDKSVEKKVLLHDERKLATGEDSTGGGTVGYDIVKSWVCACGETQAYDLKRTVV